MGKRSTSWLGYYPSNTAQIVTQNASSWARQWRKKRYKSSAAWCSSKITRLRISLKWKTSSRTRAAIAKRQRASKLSVGWWARRWRNEGRWEIAEFSRSTKWYHSARLWTKLVESVSPWRCIILVLIKLGKLYQYCRHRRPAEFIIWLWAQQLEWTYCEVPRRLHLVLQHYRAVIGAQNYLTRKARVIEQQEGRACATNWYGYW